MTTVEANAARALSPRTLQTYGQDWALFTDWCAATGHWDLPTDPDTIVEFLADCPAARSTQRCRVAAIDHQHAAGGFSKPGESAGVRAALGRPVSAREPAPPEMTDQVAAALRDLPSHGWTRGMFGRRDRCLLVLSQLAGVPYQHLARLTVGGITVVDGTATILSAARSWALLPGRTALMCGSCAVTRWLRVVDLAVTKITTAVIADAIDKAEKVTDNSLHLCRSTKKLDEATGAVPVFAPIDQWGALPFPLQPLTAHSLSHRVRDILAGDLGAHRHLPVDRVQDAEAEPPRPVPVPAGRVYSREDSQRAWARRRADLDDLAGLDDLLDDLDARAKDLQQRTAAILVGQTYPCRSDSDPEE